MNFEETIWQFETARFCIELIVSADYDLDLSFDETGEILDGINSGKYQAFQTELRVSLDGREIASDFLGGCIYESFESFMDHRGLAAKSRRDGCNYGSYFTDMARTAIADARNHVRNASALPYVRATA